MKLKIIFYNDYKMSDYCSLMSDAYRNDNIVNNNNLDKIKDKIIEIALLKNIYEFSILKMYVPDSLKLIYIEAIEKHNKNMENEEYFDSGFDLYIPNDIVIEKNKIDVNFEVKCEMINYVYSYGSCHHIPKEFIKDGKKHILTCNCIKKAVYRYRSCPSAFYLMPRSSISKKSIMLANSVGLIDSGYRGNILAKFNYFPELNIDESSTILKKNERIVQIVNTNASRIFIILVDSLDELSITKRNEGGFGSTGK